MKTKRANIIVYSIMFACIIFNSIPSEVLGVRPHIFSGCLLTLLVIIHIWLSRERFLGYLKNFLKLKAIAKINLVVDFLLMFLICLQLITGILLATDNIPQGFSKLHDFEVLHGLIAAGMFFLVVIHGCLHIKKNPKHKATK